VVAETQEGNNTSARQVQIGPDLLIPTLTVPGTAAAGATITVSDTTKNQGGGAAGASTTRFFLSTNTTLDGADVPLGSRTVPALPSGATSSGTTDVPIPADTAVGTYFVIARADADDAIAETAEGNNTVARAVQIGADLAVSVLTVPTIAAAGASITVSDTTKNQGSGPADPSTTAFYLSTNAVVDVDDVLLGTRAVPGLAAGATSSGSTVLGIPAGTATGTYYVVARADADDVVAETQEGNNASARQVQIGPDLLIATLTVPGTAAAGATITVSDTTKNQGGGAAGASTTRFYLSTDSTFDAADLPLGSRAVPGLPAGATNSGTTGVTIPTDTTVGTYYVIARADADGIVVETAEGNNTVARAVQIGADLAVSAFTVPTTAAAGASITVTDTTKNQGAGSAVVSTTAFYLSTNPVFEVGDLLLGSRAVPGLAAGATSSGSTVLGIPAGTASGTYYVVARADADDVVAETQEGNNTSARQVQIGPDLLIPTLTVPGTATAGATITVSDTTKNQGGGAASASTTRLYLSTDSTFDPADLPLASRGVAALAAGATSSGTTAVTIPADTAVGTYYVVARADADDTVTETVEGNNTVVRSIQIGP
jgi:subtilase family serine protease